MNRTMQFKEVFMKSRHYIRTQNKIEIYTEAERPQNYSIYIQLANRPGFTGVQFKVVILS